MSGTWMVRLAGMMVILTGAAGCGGKPPEAMPGQEAEGQTRIEVSGDSALDEVRRFVALGPRDSGTPGAERAANYLRDRFREIGVDAEIQAFQDSSPKGPLVFRNVIGRIPGTGGRILILGSHYDTKAGITEFEGANDSGSSTGLLLELARVLNHDAPHPMEIWLVHFDGEECMEEYGLNDGLHGSRHLARTLAESGRLNDVAAMILLDMIGDRELTVTIPRNSTPWLISMAFETARTENVRRHFQLFPHPILDDHVPFMQRGVPAINLIDFHFGSTPGRNDYWHTPADSMDKLSAESLGIAGRVARRMAVEVMHRGGAPEK